MKSATSTDTTKIAGVYQRYCDVCRKWFPVGTICTHYAVLK
jgi:hypothetical protein